MKISDKLNERETKYSYSLEYFCPKTDQGVFNLIDRIDRMVKLGPLFVDITWNAGGSSSSNTTLELVEVCERDIAINTCMHLTCIGMTDEEVDFALKTAYDAGCRNILALRGDLPKQRTPEPHCEVTGSTGTNGSVSNFEYAKDLVTHIRKKYGQEMCIGVAGYPEGHPEESDPQVLIHFLKEKCDAGADFIITQMFYDINVFLKWYHEVRAAGITIPIIPGVMPISGWSSFLRRIKWCQINLPPKWAEILEPLSNDDAAVREKGTQLVAEMCKQIIDQTDINHFHFYTMNLEKSPLMCLDALDLINEESNFVTSKTKNDTANAKINGCSRLRRGSSLRTVKPIHWRNRPSSYLSRTATWDEFPNGRWGDSRSPAFNGLNELEALLKISSATARKLWGYPTNAGDIGRIVQQYLTNQIQSLPWSESPAADEVQAINKELLKINDGSIDWFSINSQPAINGIPSADLIYGWGPAHGYVYQKANLELFVHPNVWENFLLPKLSEKPNYEVTYYAVNAQSQDLVTNSESDDVNAITWGIFPGKEVVQPTIVEGVSFMAWKDEAFRITLEWAKCYCPDSETAKLLTSIAQKWWLVNIVHHDYNDPDALFRILQT